MTGAAQPHCLVNAAYESLAKSLRELSLLHKNVTSISSATSELSSSPPIGAGNIGSFASSDNSSSTLLGKEKIKVLVSSGGGFKYCNVNNRWEYCGGETRLMNTYRTSSLHELVKHLCKVSSGATVDESNALKYELPGKDAVLVDLVDDDDVANMWDELDDYRSLGDKTYKLHLYVQGTAASVADTRTVSGGSIPESAISHNTSGSSSQSTEQAHSNSYITERPRVNLAELEAKLEIIEPAHLAVSRLLGVGGYGEVYLCKWHSADVAVKCLNPSLLSPDGAFGSVSEDVVAELIKEASMLGSLRHPNVVWVYGIVLPPMKDVRHIREHLEPGQAIDAVVMAADAANFGSLIPGMIRPPALVAEFLAGGSLRQAIARKSSVVGEDAVKVKMALDTARGMEYLHSKRIVHFDLKSANLLVGFRDKTPICKVADFGLSKQRYQTYVTGVNSMRGTLPWTAPEIIKTPSCVTEKVDVYSFGVVLWELWTGHEPFEGVNYHALMQQMTTNSNFRPAMPGSPDWDGPVPLAPCDGWVELMQRCWAELPSERPSFTDVVAELELMLSSAKARRRANTV